VKDETTDGATEGATGGATEGATGGATEGATGGAIDAATDATHMRRLRGADITAVPPLVDTLAALIERHGSLYEWAAGMPQAVALRGRAPVYVADLPDTNVTVVVRHAWHGGVLAPITGDRFRRPSRAPVEFAQSARLRAAGIATTEVLGYARYDAGVGLCRVDVVSRFERDAYDLGAVSAGLVPGISLAEALQATNMLLGQCATAGVHHPDLNVKNVLLTRGADRALRAMIIDVDVIQWDGTRPGRDTMQANVNRLIRSMKKWRTQFGADLPDATIERFAAEAMASA
jgi:Lipopolysaccharide kinase (Kdo/WaaP) family